MAAVPDTLISSAVTRLGVRLRALRSVNGWTLEQVATRSGLSEPYLSRLEGGTRQPSLAALLALAHVYGKPVHTLLDSEAEEHPACHVIRAGQAPVRNGNGLQYRVVSGGGELANLQALTVTVPAERQQRRFYRHDGEEWLYVLAGRLQLCFENEEHLLEQGDSAHFDARIPHRLAAADSCGAELLLVASACPHQQHLNECSVEPFETRSGRQLEAQSTARERQPVRTRAKRPMIDLDASPPAPEVEG